MAKEWYLMTSPYDQVSGYEDDAFDGFGEESFLETLTTKIASDVEICNYDLSVCIPLRVIIQNKTPDTELQSLQRTMLAPIGTCTAGMYVKYKDRYWLITSFVDTNDIYEKAVLNLCNWLLTWKNVDGKIIQRWCNVASASQYNNGETGMQFYFVRSDQLFINIPDDEECLLIKDRQRFIIDNRCKAYEKSFDETTISDTSHELTTYKLTRADTVLYNYIDNGYMSFIASQDEQHNDDGYYKIGDKGYWLCGEPTEEIHDEELTELTSEIVGEPIIYDGIEPSRFDAVFYNDQKEEIDVEHTWAINCDFENQLDITEGENYIEISTNNKKLINKSFELVLSASGYEDSSITVTIASFM